MKRFSTISSLLLIGTTFGFLVKGWLTPQDIHLDFSDEDVHMYL